MRFGIQELLMVIPSILMLVIAILLIIFLVKKIKN